MKIKKAAERKIKMQVENSKVFRLSWTEVNLTINEYLLNQVGHYIPCKAQMVKRDYWAMELYPYEMSVKELERLLSQNISGVDVPEELQISGRSDRVFTLDMVQSERLLSAALGHGWDWSRMDRDFLWLIQLPGREEKEPRQSLWIQGKEIFLEKLESRSRLSHYLEEHGFNEEQLKEFCNRSSYGDLLYWDCPMSDDIDKGFFLVLVREGVVKLAYDSVEIGDGAVLSMKDGLVSAKELELFCGNWNRYAMELNQAMDAMIRFIRRQEEKSNEEAKN